MSRHIDPGEKAEVPLALEALPPGSWKISVGSKEETYRSADKTVVRWPKIAESTVSITVNDDAPAAKKWEEALLADVREGKRFPIHLVEKYRVNSVIQEMLKDLRSLEPKRNQIAAHIVETAWPPEAERTVLEVIDSQLARTAISPLTGLVESKTDRDLVAGLIENASKDNSDEMLRTVLKVAHFREEDEVFERLRMHAIDSLRYFKQKEAVDELAKFLNDPAQRVRDSAKSAIANPWPPR
ncbi:MAG TPA: hypothetical protein VGN88_06915 [Phycisphaerae bacterium]